MKKKFNYLLIAIVGLVGLLELGCDRHPSSNTESGLVNVQIPLPRSLSKTDSANLGSSSAADSRSYEMQTVQLKQIESLRSMRGQYAEFFLSPQITPLGLIGSTFQGRYAQMSRGWVARDILSLTAATVYYHLQELSQWDDWTGFAQIKPQRQQVALQAMLSDQTSGLVYSNAMFEAQSKGLLITPYQEKDMPIGMNPGILAHEHFHALFEPLVQSELRQKEYIPSSLEKLSAVSVEKLLWLKTINEGLADFWGWAYTDDFDFISSSLPSKLICRGNPDEHCRSLKVEDPKTILPLSTHLMIQFAAQDMTSLSVESKTEVILHQGYLFGTGWARFFKMLTEKYAVDKKIDLSTAKVQVMKQLTVALKKMSQQMLALDAKKSYDPQTFLVNFQQGLLSESPAAAELKNTQELIQKTLEKMNENNKSVQKFNSEVLSLRLKNYWNF